ncbi:MAG TPA: FAD-containing oxidoreductase [Roseomonas sp.]|jgi:pyruvate/2-oxoglutarate dehydrogenase complex dihydrolipoamide dehydrogenase (E3) component
MPPAPETVDAIIIGTGQASPALANRLTKAGLSVAVIERGLVGGSCVNVGCTPTKALVASAHAARQAARALEYGVLLPHGPIRVDMAAVQDRAAAISAEHRTGLERWLGGMPRCELIRGHARFESARTVRIGERLLQAGRIFLNVGARALIPDIPGLADVSYLTNTGIVGLRTLPRHLVILGGSYIGLEFGQMFRRFGAEVTVIERGPRLIGREDADVSEQVRAILAAEGVGFRLGAGIRGVAAADGIAVEIDGAGGAETIRGSHLLVAIGRRPNTDDLGLDKAGIATDAHGYVTVDDRLATNVPGIWALGDCNGRGAFTHTAYDDYEIVARNLLDGAQRSVADRIPAYALYVDPPLGRVGMTVAQAQASGRKVRVGMRPMTRVARAVEKGEAQGLMRIVVDAESDAILGGTVFGPGGDEAVHMILMAMAAGTPASRFAQVMAIHPTVSELLPTIAGELKDPAGAS